MVHGSFRNCTMLNRTEKNNHNTQVYSIYILAKLRLIGNKNHIPEQRYIFSHMLKFNANKLFSSFTIVAYYGFTTSILKWCRREIKKKLVNIANCLQLHKKMARKWVLIFSHPTSILADKNRYFKKTYICLHVDLWDGFY